MWYNVYDLPLSLSTDAIDYSDSDFESKLIRTDLYERADTLIDAIHMQQGKFWVVSKESGYGKSTLMNYFVRNFLKRLDQLKTLPFIVQIEHPESPKDVQRIIQREVVLSLLSLDRVLEKFHQYWSDKDALARIRTELSQRREQLLNLRKKAFTASDKEMDLAFWNAM